MKKLMRYVRIGVGLLGLFVLISGSLASDAGMEFGVEDDLTVFGTEGDINDADFEVKGYSVFGTTNGATTAISGAGNVFVSGTLEASNLVVKTMTVGDNMTVSNLNVLGYLDVVGSSELDSSLTVNTNVVIQGNQDIKDSLSVSNDATIGNTLSVISDTDVGGDLTVEGNSYLLGDVKAYSDLQVDGSLSVSNSTLLESNLTVNGITTLESSSYLASKSGNVAIGTNAVSANSKFDVVAEDVSGNYASKFYFGTNVAAWIRKK